MGIFQSAADGVVSGLVNVMADGIYPMMFVGFFATVFLKLLVVYTIKRQQWFSREFEKRIVRHLDRFNHEESEKISFYLSCKRLLERTYYELFEVRGIMQRRNMDYISSPLDRLFAIQHGCARFVKDTLKEIRFLKHKGDNPRFLEISKTVMGNNPAFSKLFGWIPLGPLNELLNLIPGLFIIGGIFGTFLGIMQGLPELGNLDLKNPEASKVVMDTFLIKIAFSIGTSVIGIFFSVLLSVMYSLIQVEKVYMKVVDTYDRCLTRLWEISTDNIVPLNLASFDEHKDPLDALAQMAVEKEATTTKWAKRLGGSESDEVITKKAS